MINKLYLDIYWLNNQYITLKKSINEITEICGGGDIYYWLKKHKILVRPQSEAIKISHNKPEIKKKMRKAKSGENNPMFGRIGKKSPIYGKKNYWFDKTGKDHPAYKDGNGLYTNLHTWINRYFLKLRLCEICNLPKYYDERHGKLEWSNKTGKLIKDRNNWQYIHRSCHKIYDYKNKIIHKGIKKERINIEYGRLHTRINEFPKLNFCEICKKPISGRMEWSNKTGKLIRDRNNWQYIHIKCHKKYDIKNKIIHDGL